MDKTKKSKPSIDIDLLDPTSLKTLSEDDFRQSVIFPLIKELGGEHVLDLHGHNEQGIDIYFEWSDVFSHIRRFGIQLKKGDLICTSQPNANRNIRTICNQIQMGFSKKLIFADSHNGKTEYTIDGYYVMISGKMNDTASMYIYEQRKVFPYIHILEGEEVLRIIKFRNDRKMKGIR